MPSSVPLITIHYTAKRSPEGKQCAVCTAAAAVGAAGRGLGSIDIETSTGRHRDGFGVTLFRPAAAERTMPHDECYSMHRGMALAHLHCHTTRPTPICHSLYTVTGLRILQLSTF
jgi:hypothetical protein